MTDKAKPNVIQVNQGDQSGEGNYDATRRYRQGLEQSMREGKSEELAKEAEEALEGPEGKALREAEEKAKRGQIPGGAPRR